MKDLLDLFLVFAKIGGFTFGGGYAMLPILQREVVETRKWATNEELMDYYAIGQCTPGIIAVNTATFIGNKRRGVLGGIVATIGCVTPSIIIIMLIAALIKQFADIVWVQHALAGIRVAVCVLVFDTVLKLAKKSLKDVVTYLIFAAVILLTLFTKLPAVLWVVNAAVIGIAYKIITERKKTSGKEAA